MKFIPAGDYSVTLKVTDKDGGVGSAQTLLSVESFPVQIRIASPGQRKPINAKSGGKLPVSILGSSDFNVEDIDLSSLLISNEIGTGIAVAQKPNGDYFASTTDINKDGIFDLLIHVEIDALAQAGNFSPNTNELVVTGSLSDNCVQFEGRDEIQGIF